MYFDADRYEKKKRGITKLCIQRKLWIEIISEGREETEALDAVLEILQ